MLVSQISNPSMLFCNFILKFCMRTKKKESKDFNMKNYHYKNRKWKYVNNIIFLR